MDIGFIGVGNMGAGMANNLLKAGYTLTINDIRRDAAGPLLEKGARWAETPQQVAMHSEITFTSLPGPPEVEAVALGRGLGPSRAGPSSSASASFGAGRVDGVRRRAA